MSLFLEQNPNFSIDSTGAIVWRNKLDQQGFTRTPMYNWQKSWEDMGALEKALSVLSVGQYVSANIVNEILRGTWDIGGAVWDGLTMKERGDFIDILRQHGVPWAPVLGTILNIGLDPTTWLPGPVSVFKKFASAGSIGKGLQAATKLVNDINPINKIVGLVDNALSTRRKIPADLFRELDLAKLGYKQDLVDVAHHWNKFFEKIDPKKAKFFYQWAYTVPTDPKDFDTYNEFITNLLHLTARSIDAKLITPNAMAKAIRSGKIKYLPTTLMESLLNAFEKGKLEGPFTEYLQKAIANYNYAEEATKVSNFVRQLAELNDADEIMTAAMNGMYKFSDNEITQNWLHDIVDYAFQAGKDNVASIKEALQSYANHILPSGYLPQVFFGRVTGWKPGRLLSARGKIPFTYARRLGVEAKEWIPTMRNISLSFEEISRGASVDEIRKKASQVVESLGENRRLQRWVQSIVDDTFRGIGDDVAKLKNAFKNHAVYYAPIEDVGDLMKLYHSNLVRVEAQERLKRTVFANKDWLPPVTGDIPQGFTAVTSAADVENLIARLSEMKATREAAETALKKDPSKLYEMTKLVEPKRKPTPVTDWTRIRKGTWLRDPSGVIYKYVRTDGGTLILQDAVGRDVHYSLADLVNQKWEKVQLEKGALDELKKELLPADVKESLINGLKSLLKDKEKKTYFSDVLSVDAKKAARLMRQLSTAGYSDDLIRVADPEIAEALGKARKIWYADISPMDPTAKGLLNLYDKLIGHWAKWATIMRWPYFVRNVISNTFNMFLGGMEPWEIPLDVNLAGIIQKGGNKVVEIAGVKRTADEWLNLFGRYGIRGHGLAQAIASSDVDMAILGLTGKLPRNTSKLAKLYDIGLKVNQAVDDNARIALAINVLKKTKGDIDAAANTVWKFLFRYDEMTDFERKVIKRVFPFYSWIRKNLPLQLEMMMSKPGRYVQAYKYFNMFRSLNPETPDDIKFKPEWMQDYLQFKLPDNIKKWYEKLGGLKLADSVYVNIDLPWNSIVDIAGLDNLIQTFFASLSPVKILVGLGMNATMGFPNIGDRIETFKGELQPAPWPFMLLPEFLHPILGMRPMKDKDTGRTIVGMPVKAVTAIMNLVPGIYELTKMLPQGKTFLEDEEAPWRALRFLTGINFTPIDQAEERMWYKIRQKNKLRDAAKLAAQLGRPLRKEELEELLKD